MGIQVCLDTIALWLCRLGGMIGDPIVRAVERAEARHDAKSTDGTRLK